MAEDIHWRKYAGRFRTFPKLIDNEIDPDVRMIICIPVCAEPDVLSTMDSLYQCEHQEFKVEVILFFNKNSMMSDLEIDRHNQSWNECSGWVNKHHKEGISFLPVYLDELPDPLGGVGWARKIAMDEAARRLGTDGILVCLDADCIVASDYVKEIHHQFERHLSYDAASIYFEHPYDQLNSDDRDAIIQYELHLRYLVHAQRWCGHPHAYQTVGSSLAVRRNAYLSQGGMNTKRAGEDFYFLQKFIETGKLFEINTTTVYPSPRISNRVPFGTGKAMQKRQVDKKEWLTTDFRTFQSIKPLFTSLFLLWEYAQEHNGKDYDGLKKQFGFNGELLAYMEKISFLNEINSICHHTASFQAFQKRFFRYFNAFRMIRYMHYMRDHAWPDVVLSKAIAELALALNLLVPEDANAEKYLSLFRMKDKRNNE